jgi:hypothetical protein
MSAANPSAFDQVRRAVEAALQQVPALQLALLSSGQELQAVFDRRVQVEVQLGETRGQRHLAGLGAPMRWDTALVIVLKVRAGAGDLADSELDDLVLATEEALPTLDLAALGASLADQEPQWRWARQEGPPPFATARRLLRITHETVGSGLTPRP